MTHPEELPEQGTHSHGGRARTGRLHSLPAEGILDINISNHFLSQLTSGVPMATTLEHRLMLSDVNPRAAENLIVMAALEIMLNRFLVALLALCTKCSPIQQDMICFILL